MDLILKTVYIKVIINVAFVRKGMSWMSKSEIVTRGLVSLIFFIILGNKGVKFCENNKDIVCRKGYWQQTDTSKCINNEDDTQNRIENCKNHRISSRLIMTDAENHTTKNEQLCYQCINFSQ